MTQLPPAVRAEADNIAAVYGDAMIECRGPGWHARPPLPGEALPPETTPRGRRGRALAELARLRRMRDRARKGSHRR